MKYLIGFLAICLSVNLFAKAPVPDTSHLTSSNPDYTYWKSLSLSHEGYCDQNFLDTIVNEYGYNVNEVEHSYEEDGEPMTDIYRKYYKDVYPQQYIEIPSSQAKISRLTATCWEVRRQLGGIELGASQDDGVNAPLFEMESDATYFQEEDARGPKVSAWVTMASLYLNVKLEILYLSENGWTVAASMDIDDQSIDDYNLNATLPYPAQVKLRLWWPGEWAGDMETDNPAVEIKRVTFYTEECIPNLANPGLCL